MVVLDSRLIADGKTLANGDLVSGEMRVEEVWHEPDKVILGVAVDAGASCDVDIQTKIYRGDEGYTRIPSLTSPDTVSGKHVYSFDEIEDMIQVTITNVSGGQTTVSASMVAEAVQYQGISSGETKERRMMTVTVDEMLSTAGVTASSVGLML